MIEVTTEQLRAIWLSGFKSGACTVIANTTTASDEEVSDIGQTLSSAAGRGEGAASIDREVREILTGENMSVLRTRQVRVHADEESS